MLDAQRASEIKRLYLDAEYASWFHNKQNTEQGIFEQARIIVCSLEKMIPPARGAARGPSGYCGYAPERGVYEIRRSVVLTLPS